MQQNVPKNQHFLPFAYLRQFSIDRAVPRKKSEIWRLDESEHGIRKTAKQCHMPFFYSAKEPAKAEAFFHESENFFADVAKRIWLREPCRGERDYYGLLIFMVSVHIRNPAYRIDLPSERIEAYKLLEQQVVHHVLFRGAPTVPNEDELRAVLHSNWGVRLLCVPDHETELLITSDNPSLLFTLNESGDVHYLILPVTPRCCAIAFDRTALAVSGDSLSLREVETLNVLQALSMNEAIFSSTPFSPEDQKTAPLLWKNRQPRNGYIDATDWNMNVFKHRPELGFIRPTKEEAPR